MKVGPQLSASKTALLESCAYWAREDAVQDPRVEKEIATDGTDFHAAVSAFVETGRLEIYREAIADKVTSAIEWLHGLGVSRDRMQAEIAFGWDPETDTAVVYDVKDRQYPDDGRLHGTADLLVWRAGGLELYDWKAGEGFGGGGSGPQLRTLALMASRAYQIDDVTVAALEPSSSGVAEVCRETLDSFALSAVAGELASLLEAVPAAEPTPGHWCGEWWCPSKLSCPLSAAGVAELVDVIPSTALVRKKYSLTAPIETADHAAWAVSVISLMNSKIGELKDRIKAMVPKDGWQLEDGRVLKETKAEATGFDKGKALGLLIQLGATPEQMAALEYTYERSNGLRVVGGEKKPRTRKTKAV